MQLVRWQEGHQISKKTEWWGVGMVISLWQDADVHKAQLMPIVLAVSCFSKSRLVLPFWYRLAGVVPVKWPLNGYCCLSLGFIFQRSL